jgi:hypothetical protein
MPEVWAALVADDGPAIAASGRISRRTFTRLLDSDITDLEKIHFALQAVGRSGRSLHVDGPNVRWATGWSDAQRILRDDIMRHNPADPNRGQPQLWLNRPGAPGQFPRSSRVSDYAEWTPDGWVLHEVKAGVPFDLDADNIIECQEDAWYRDPANQAKILADNAHNPQFRNTKVKGVHWHFMPNGNGGRNELGVSDAVLNCLKEHDIPFTIHFPTD